MHKNIGFVSTRFAGTDGVSLESSKWAEVLQQGGHQCFWFAGALDRTSECSFHVPEADFKTEQNQWINERVFGQKGRKQPVTQTIHDLRSHLKFKLHEFIKQFKMMRAIFLLHFWRVSMTINLSHVYLLNRLIKQLTSN